MRLFHGTHQLTLQDLCPREALAHCANVFLVHQREHHRYLACGIDRLAIARRLIDGNCRPEGLARLEFVSLDVVTIHQLEQLIYKHFNHPGTSQAWKFATDEIPHGLLQCLASLGSVLSFAVGLPAFHAACPLFCIPSDCASASSWLGRNPRAFTVAIIS